MAFLDRFKKAETEDTPILPMNEERILKARQTLRDYKSAKELYTQRLIKDEEWYRLRHWGEIPHTATSDVQPSSAWLFNSIENKHADMVDNSPSPNIIPREESDKPEAEILSSIIPVILDQAEFDTTFAKVEYDRIKCGTGIYGVFFDQTKLNGLGDISIVPIDPISIFWEAGIDDIQKSRNVFTVELRDNDLLEEEYPQLKGKLGGKDFSNPTYANDSHIDTTNKSEVIDWYYKRVVNGKTVLHYCRFVGNTVLFATENETTRPTEIQVVTDEFGNQVEQEVEVGESLSERGWYAHGMYPFVFSTLFPAKGTPVGFGYIDVGKSAQEYIDRIDKAIVENALVNAKPRYFVRDDAQVNLADFANFNQSFVRCGGSLGEESIKPMTHQNLSGIYLSVQQAKIDQLKETTGNRDVNNGGTTGGVTSASGVAALQEAAGRLSRDHVRGAYRAYKKIIYMVIELIREFYDVQRTFRIVGERGEERYVQYSNAGIVPQPQGNDFGIDMGYRIPQFDIEVTAEKTSAYTRLGQNELALQFYGAGFFAPTNADASLACLDMMDFPHKQDVIDKVSQNQTLLQMVQAQQAQIMQMQQVLGIANPMVAQNAAVAQSIGDSEQHDVPEIPEEEPAVTRKARERAAQAVSIE